MSICYIGIVFFFIVGIINYWMVDLITNAIR